MVKEYSIRSKGIRPSQWRLYWDDLAEISIELPSRRTQRAIAVFLDAETARIDALMAKTRRPAALFLERQLVNVFEAVTGGDWKGPLRDFGLSWVDKLPAHWGAPWLGSDYETQLGKMLDAEAAAGDKQAPYVRNVNVQWDRIDLVNLASMSFSDSDRVRCELRGGDLLVCEGGEVGRAAVWPSDVKGIYFQKAIHRVRPLKDGNTRFLMYCLRAAAHLNVFAVEGNQSTIVHLTGEKLREHRFPFPPPEEQGSIVRRLDEDRDRTKVLIDRLERQITLLQERRQALITAAVTGELEIPGVPA